MQKQLTVGLVPLYIALYERAVPFRRPQMEAFYETVAKALESRGYRVLRAPICHVKPEFKAAVSSFEAGGADCLVTIHLAYSPSLESIDVLASTKLPIVVFDTTLVHDFSPMQSPDEIGQCHGIHGVMDMCNLLKRRGKPYAIAAGHLTESPVLGRVDKLIRAGVAASSLDGMKAASIGGSFDGMGDFAVTDTEMKQRFGVEVLYPSVEELTAAAAAITDDEIAAEMAVDYTLGNAVNPIDEALHARSTRACLAVRRWLDEHHAGAYTANFLNISDSGLSTMPFMEAGKAMARGVGYAGEGDILTAAFCGALLRGFADTSFVEIFCPDWKGGRVMLSHMGEMNFTCADRPLELTEMNFIYGTAENPIVGFSCFRGGEAVFANLYNDGTSYRLLLAPVTMDAAPADDRFTCKMRGWLKPAMPVEQFLEGISRAGATHHSVLVYDATVEALEYFGQILGLPVEVLA